MKMPHSRACGRMGKLRPVLSPVLFADGLELGGPPHPQEEQAPQGGVRRLEAGGPGIARIPLSGELFGKCLL